MSIGETLVERRNHRRLAGVASSGRLKGNKITVSNEGKSKPQKQKRDGDTDITVESPEFQLLVQLYVPAKLLIKNNKVLKKQLSNYLPVIVNESVPELNFELHIFLSSIVTAYVTTWYLSKLNTDDFDFLESVYGILCEFVKDFAHRLLAIVELPNLLDLVNDLAHTLDSHIRLAQLENGTPRMVNEYMERNKSSVRSEKEMRTDAMIDQILLESHVIFSQNVPWQSVTDPRIGEETSVATNEEPDDPYLNYLRVTIRNIILTTFNLTKETTLMGQGPTTSVIVMNLLTIVLADLVFEKIITKLSSPQFILRTVGGKIASELQKQRSGDKISETLPIHKRVTSAIQGAYIGISKLAIAFSRHDAAKSDLGGLSILYSPIFSLADAITNFSGRKPLVTYLAQVGRSILLSTRSISLKFESAARTYLAGCIRLSPVLEDKFLATIVQMLTGIVFSQTEENSDRKENNTIEELTNTWFNLMQGKTLPLSLLWFAYQGESEVDIKKSIEDFLAIFDAESKNHAAPFSASSKLNKLLAIRLFDSTVQYVYPELVATVDNMQDRELSL